MVRRERGGGVGNNFQILVDSDAFVGQFYAKDPHHANALSVFSQLERNQERIAATSMVVAETATVLSHRSGQDLARKFFSAIKKSKLPIIHINEELQEQAINIFQNQKKRGTSMTDCANVAVANLFGIATIFSFDKFYAKQFGMKLM